MIVVKNIGKIYKTEGHETEALKGLDLEVKRGDFLAVMGPSGCGKSTLLNIIGAMDVATSGEYFYEGEAVHQKKMNALHEFRKKHISFVFQNFALIPHYTVYENVEIPLIAKGIKKRLRKKIIMEVLTRLEIADIAEKLPTHISGGQQQRTAIARALASGNELILADEPTGALDSKTARDIMELFQKLNGEGKTIIVITHDENVAGFAKRVLHMSDGVFVE